MPTPGVPPWGCPWHGLVESGSLELPNGQLMAYPQPSVGVQQAGNTLLQRMPWAVDPVPASEEQAAFDAAQGRQWMPWAILAGADKGLHGRNLQGWIYADPTGTPWLVDGSAVNNPLSDPTTLTGTVRLSRFGVLGGKPDVYERSVSAATGQSTPALSLSGSVQVEVMDIVPDGSKAILMLHTRTTAQVIGALMPMGLFAIGFLQVQISGTPGINLEVNITVLKTRAETLGVGSDTGYALPAAANAYVSNPASSTLLKTDVAIVGGVYPACTGYREETTTYHPAVTTMGDTPPGTPSGTTKRVYVGEYSRTTEINGRIVAMWFDGGGAARPVTLDLSVLSSSEYPAFDFSQSGKVVTRYPYTAGAGVCVLGAAQNIEQSLTFRLGRTIKNRVEAKATLAFDGQQVEETCLYTSDVYYFDEDQAFQRDTAFAFDTPAHEEEETSSGSLLEDFWWQGQVPSFVDGLQLDVTDGERYLIKNVQFGFAQNWWLGACRYSNNLIGLFAAWRATGSSAPSGRFLGTLSPGATTSNETPLYSSSQLTARLKGSYHPVTHAVARNSTQYSCWV